MSVGVVVRLWEGEKPPERVSVAAVPWCIESTLAANVLSKFTSNYHPPHSPAIASSQLHTGRDLDGGGPTLNDTADSQPCILQE